MAIWRDVDEYSFASTDVGPFRLRAATSVYSVNGGTLGASGMASGIGDAKRRAIAVLRKHLEQSHEETIEGRRVEELLAELGELDAG